MTEHTPITETATHTLLRRLCGPLVVPISGPMEWEAEITRKEAERIIGAADATPGVKAVIDIAPSPAHPHQLRVVDQAGL